MKQLSPAAEQFILHWGEMSGRWGISRSVAQIHALLYISSNSLNAEEIANTLSMARSNVSTSLRELQAWGIIRIVHALGDRRDYFEPIGDAWDVFQAIIEHKKKHEIDPTIEMLRECVRGKGREKKQDRHAIKKMSEMLELIEMATELYDQVVKLPRTTQKKLLAMGSRLQKFIGGSK
jgi:DNA-binding transcriptional regulator GbsR (MarR family)